MEIIGVGHLGKNEGNTSRRSKRKKFVLLVGEGRGKSGRLRERNRKEFVVVGASGE
jgi:hypothetical protein